MKDLTTVEKQRGFRIHLIVFVAVMAGLIVLNLVLGAPYWFQWPLLGWGIGIIAHYIWGHRVDAPSELLPFCVPSCCARKSNEALPPSSFLLLGLR